MTVHTLLATEAFMHRMATQAQTYVNVATPETLEIVVGDVVQFLYNEETEWLRPPRPVMHLQSGRMALGPEETLIQAQRRWRKEDRNATTR